MPTLSIVTGAPGSGKSCALDELLLLRLPVVALDMDWLIGSASALANRDIRFDPSTWAAYGDLWFDVLHGIARNDRTPVLFAPLSPADLRAEMPSWCTPVSWLLLDCSDGIRADRLRARGWPAKRTQEAIRDASDLRSQIQTSIGTDAGSASSTAAEIAAWLRLSPETP